MVIKIASRERGGQKALMTEHGGYASIGGKSAFQKTLPC
jgi:hypothetical protein